ncbi:MAG: CBS domain-containing protein [Betaproteobacteria bacterium]
MINQPIRAVLQAKDIQNLITAAPDATVAEAAALMAQKGVGALIVGGGGNGIGGIFTERDVMCRVVAERRDPAATKVSDVMSPNVRQMDADATVEEVLRLMVVHGHRHILIKDGAGFGLVSIRDLMQWLILPDEPVAHEGRVGVIRARTAETIGAVKGLQP